MIKEKGVAVRRSRALYLLCCELLRRSTNKRQLLQNNGEAWTVSCNVVFSNYDRTYVCSVANKGLWKEKIRQIK
jgi:hypothetical protein